MEPFEDSEQDASPSSEEADLRERGVELLPAWLARRMMGSAWYFGLMMSNGTVIEIENVKRVTRDAAGDLWLDVTLLGVSIYPRGFSAPSGRRDASINVKHIAMAFELADT